METGNTNATSGFAEGKEREREPEKTEEERKTGETLGINKYH
jgi:hypothetical protein